MCGRFSLGVKIEEVQEHFQTNNTLAYSPHYNISPKQGIVAIRQLRYKRHMDLLYWGLKPYYVKTASFSARINVRAETAYQKFRQDLQYRRCLIPATGFYEWQKTEQGKLPYYIKPKDKNIIAFAGIWETDSAGQALNERCAILTTEAVPELMPIHERIPVILTEDNYAAWINPANQDIHSINRLLKAASIPLSIHRVSTKVNNSRYDAVDCIEPISQ
jgi:putative SOS response-associated peptidase YedK